MHIAALRVVTVLIVIASAVFLTQAGQGSAQDDDSSLPAALVTFVNPSTSARSVSLAEISGDGVATSLMVRFVATEDVSTFTLDAGATPKQYVATCAGCRDAAFAVANGQRIIVFMLSTADAVALRSDVRVVNESGLRQRGALRTGAELGSGRSALRFDLSHNEGASVGMRFDAGQFADFNLSCDACTGLSARVGNGVDLELVIR